MLLELFFFVDYNFKVFMEWGLGKLKENINVWNWG